MVAYLRFADRWVTLNVGDVREWHESWTHGLGHCRLTCGVRVVTFVSLTVAVTGPGSLAAGAAADAVGPAAAAASGRRTLQRTAGAASGRPGPGDAGAHPGGHVRGRVSRAAGAGHAACPPAGVAGSPDAARARPLPVRGERAARGGGVHSAG